MKKKYSMYIDSSFSDSSHLIISDEKKRIFFYEQEIRSKNDYKGDIFLAQVTRIEPSLQAVFVNYGNKKQGFLPFSEIHPDYYQLPEDRREKISKRKEEDSKNVFSLKNINEDAFVYVLVADNPRRKKTKAYQEFEKYLSGETVKKNLERGISRQTLRKDLIKGYIELREQINESLSIAGESCHSHKNVVDYHFYNVQEVIKTDQVLLVQIEREVKRNKGALLTTYISLVGRYCVLMPKSFGRIHVSKKIVNSSETMRLSKFAEKMLLQVNDKKISLLMKSNSRRVKLKVLKDDFKKQISIWDSIKEITLASIAPQLIYKEADQVQRAVRDFYTSDIGEIHVDTKKTFDTITKLFKKDTRPPQVILYKGIKGSIFSENNIINQLCMINKKRIDLPSGGYIIIDITEALVAIDINSGKFNKENNIHETALKTNVEAVDEVARQILLRDLSGIIIIDFIKMQNASNNKFIHNRLKKLMQKDLAFNQVGIINSFGILCLSRQRIANAVDDDMLSDCEKCFSRSSLLTLAFASRLVIRLISCYIQKNKTLRGTLNINCNPEIVVYLMKNFSRHIKLFSKFTSLKISLRSDPKIKIREDVDFLLFKK